MLVECSYILKNSLYMLQLLFLNPLTIIPFFKNLLFLFNCERMKQFLKSDDVEYSMKTSGLE